MKNLLKLGVLIISLVMLIMTINNLNKINKNLEEIEDLLETETDTVMICEPDSSLTVYFKEI